MKKLTDIEIRKAIAIIEAHAIKNPQFLAYCEVCKDVHIFSDDTEQSCWDSWKISMKELSK